MAGGVGIMSMDYLGGFQYQGTALKFFPTAEGYVQATALKVGFAYSYVYNYRDHLGNIRLSYAQDPENPNALKIIEESHYYPFGLKHANYNSDQLAFKEKDPGPGLMLMAAAAAIDPVPQFVYNYKYNGKEFQDEMGLNWYDMEMRDYDPAIGRWIAQDPIVHFDYSPYIAFDNNPVFWADPSGADSETDIFGRATRDQWGLYIAPYERTNSDQDSYIAYIDKAAAISLKETAKLYIDGVDLSTLSETDKQKIFKTDEIGTIGVLLWEFATGTGKGTRKFKVGVHPFANKLLEGRILEEIINEFNEKATNDGYDFSKAGNSKEYNIALEFSPSKSPSSWLESVKKHINKIRVQFFVGGAIAKVRIQDNNLIIQIYNETSRRSLMLHMAENYNRKDSHRPLSTVKQYINASYKLIKN